MLYILHSKFLMKCLNEFIINSFCCVDMYENSNPHRHRLDKETITDSVRRESGRKPY